MYTYIHARTHTTWVSYTSAFYGGGHRECRARITNNVHTGRRGQAGIKKQKQAREQKDWLGLIPGGVRDGVFWLHDLIPGYALEQDNWVKQCLLSMFLEWSAVSFFMEPSASRRVRWMRASFFSFFSFSFFSSFGLLAAPTTPLRLPPPACVVLIRQKVGFFGLGYIGFVGDG